MSDYITASERLADETNQSYIKMAIKGVAFAAVLYGLFATLYALGE